MDTTEPHSQLPPARPATAAAGRLKRVVLAALIALVALNVWTGSPLLALWIGSRLHGSGPPKMSSVFVVAAALAVLSFALLKLLAVLGAAYDRAASHTRTVRTHAPWLRSMRGERELYPGERPQLSAVERIVIAVVVLAVIAFEIWFFFFSSSPIDQRSGRGAAPIHHVEVAAARIPAP